MIHSIIKLYCSTVSSEEEDWTPDGSDLVSANEKAQKGWDCEGQEMAGWLAGLCTRMPMLGLGKPMMGSRTSISPTKRNVRSP